MIDDTETTIKVGPSTTTHLYQAIFSNPYLWIFLIVSLLIIIPFPAIFFHLLRVPTSFGSWLTFYPPYLAASVPVIFGCYQIFKQAKTQAHGYISCSKFSIKLFELKNDK